MNKHLNLNLENIDPILIKKIRGIYFLYNEKELVYIGKSNKNILDRLSCHLVDENKIFDNYKFLEIEDNEDIVQIEKDFINKYKPKYNKKDRGEITDNDFNKFYEPYTYQKVEFNFSIL